MTQRLAPYLGRHILAIAGVASIASVLGACSTTPPASYVVNGKSYGMGKDVACLEQQTEGFHLPFYRATAVCGDKVPDLTGDGKLQREAWAWQIPFAINRAADTAIKQKFPHTQTGHLIANAMPDRTFAGGPYD